MACDKERPFGKGVIQVSLEGLKDFRGWKDREGQTCVGVEVGGAGFRLDSDVAGYSDSLGWYSGWCEDRKCRKGGWGKTVESWNAVYLSSLVTADIWEVVTDVRREACGHKIKQ